MRPANVPSKRTWTLVLSVIFLTGMSGLIYQIAWFRQLALVFGVTSYAQGIVLAAFMSGLALGGLGGGWLVDRVRNPLRAYAIVEILVGVTGWLTLPLLGAVQALYVRLAPAMMDDAAIHALRFFLSFLVLLVPTAAMGATLPLLVSAWAPSHGAGKAVSSLYAVNTLGAVMGVLSAGFLLLGVVGINMSLSLAAVLNVGAGFCLLAFVPPLVQQPSECSPGSVPLDSLRRTVLVVFALSGLTALAYEILWARLFSVVALGLVYGFSTMLALVLAGIAVGSALYGWWRPQENDKAALDLAYLEAGIGIFIGLSPLWLAWSGEIGVRSLSAWPLVEAVTRRCPGCLTVGPALALLVFGSSVLFGATFPAATRACAGIGPRWTVRFGTAYAINLVGAMLGSILAGFWLLPMFGVHKSLMLLAALNVAAGVALVGRLKGRRGVAAIVAVSAATFALVILWGPNADVYRTVLSARVGRAAELSWYDEGLEDSVAIIRQPDGAQALLINGEFHGSTVGEAYHAQLGHLGPLLHPNPRDVLVIGLGRGTTVGTTALYPGMSIDVLELSAGVREAARSFATANHRVLENPRVSLRLDDGRNHLLISSRQYDLIEADILHPNHAGAGIVYSREFFELTRRALKPGGLMVQWLGSPSQPLIYGWTMRTFTSVFPHVSFWMEGDVAVGSNEPQRGLDTARFANAIADPQLRQALVEAGIPNRKALEALQALSPVEAVLQGPVITDDRPSIEYFLTLPALSRFLGVPPVRSRGDAE